MIQKKVCMVGAFATGKTSLVSRFIKGLYSDKYQTTIGVKIDKKPVILGDQTINMVLWDIYGEDEFQNIRMSYLRGAAGYLLVVDGTRRETLEVAVQLQARVEQYIGPVPFVLIVNKFDRQAEWEVQDNDLADLQHRGWTIFKGSAKTALGVEESFLALAQQIMVPPKPSLSPA